MNAKRANLPEAPAEAIVASPSNPHRAGDADGVGRNQRWMSRRFQSLRERLVTGAAGTLPTADEEDRGFESAHQRLQRLFGLSKFEGDLLLLAAGVECDAPLRSALAQVEAAEAGTGVGFAVALAHLEGAHWDAVSPQSPLRLWRLLQTVGDGALGQARLRIDERVLHYLMGVPAVDPRLAGIARLIETAPETTAVPAPAAEMASSRRLSLDDDVSVDGADGRPANSASATLLDIAARAVAQALMQQPSALVLLAMAPQQAASRRTARALVRQALAQLPLNALWVDTGTLDADPRAGAELALALDREAALSAAVIVLTAPPQGAADQGSGDAGPAVLRLLSRLRSPVLLLGPVGAAELADLPARQPVRVAVPELPRRAAGRRAEATAPEWGAALQQFQVDDDLMAQALAGLPDGDGAVRGAALWQTLRVASRGGLDGLAQRIEAPTALSDLVLSAAAMDTLRDITLQLRHRAQVHEAWGFAAPGGRGLGLAALFTGDSGTGKTFAAEAIANEVKLDLYRIDLALTVSKYIGETEKNLRRLFDAAEGSGAVLLFDEADALFGKRSDIKDSHDRYANIEVAYLLQRIESYRGLAILTTNMKQALDRAFLRRLRFVVHFPFPDEAARKALWRRQFPAQAPLADDVDWRALARLHLTGGHIRNVALNAAFRAAADGGAIAQRHVMDAARAEYAKLERSFGTAGGPA